MQPTTRFLQGSANDVYDRIFVPLSKEVGIIKCSKQAYGCNPFVKLRTVNEGDPKLVQVTCSIVDSAYTNRYNSLVTTATRSCTELRNVAGSIINFASPNFMWNCLPTKTGQTLDTAVQAFYERIDQLKLEIDQGICSQDLHDLKKEIGQVRATLNFALKTVFYIYRTYNQNPEMDGGEELVSSNQQEVLRSQYVAIRNLINQDFASLLQCIDAKLNPPQLHVDLEQSIASEFNSLSLTETCHPDVHQETVLCPIVAEETQRFAQDVMIDKALVFKSSEAASKWFKSTLVRSRLASEMVSGPSCFSNLMHSARIAKTVPQAFVSFGKTLDAVFRDKYAHYNTVQEVCQRFNGILAASGRPLKLNQHNNFKKLFIELCNLKVSREVYQDFFRALMNAQGTAPFGLQYEAAILNAIMNSEYFPMFDSEHQLP